MRYSPPLTTQDTTHPSPTLKTLANCMGKSQKRNTTYKREGILSAPNSQRHTLHRNGTLALKKRLTNSAEATLGCTALAADHAIFLPLFMPPTYNLNPLNQAHRPSRGKHSPPRHLSFPGASSLTMP